MRIRPQVSRRAIPLALVGVALASVAGCGVTTAGDAAASDTVAAAAPKSELSAESLALLRAGGSTMRLARTTEAKAAKVSAATATEAATRRFGLTAQRRPDEQVLAKVTNNRFPHVVTPQDSPRPAAQPLLVDMLCWISVFKGVPLQQPATLLVLVDATSGKLVRTETG